MRNKYRNIWTKYNGANFQSRREARHAAELDLLVRAGEIASWRRQVRIPLVVNGHKITHYVADFEVKYSNGDLVYQEVKGLWTDTAKLKWALLQACWPNLKTEVVK